MQKPNNFDETRATGSYTPPAVGGHVAQIIGVKEMTNRAGGDMIVVAFDFAGMDEQRGYFSAQYAQDDRQNKKWPYQGTSYINVHDKDNNCSRSFKSFCACVEESNKGFAVNWKAEDWGAQFKGKAVGVVFGMVEEEYNGKRRQRAQLRWFTGADKALEAKVPEPKLLPSTGTTFHEAVEAAANDNEFIPF